MCEVSEVRGQYWGRGRVFSSTCITHFDKCLSSEFIPNWCLLLCLLKQTTLNSLQITFTFTMIRNSVLRNDSFFNEVVAFHSEGVIPSAPTAAQRKKFRNNADLYSYDPVQKRLIRRWDNLTALPLHLCYTTIRELHLFQSHLLASELFELARSILLRINSEMYAGGLSTTVYDARKVHFLVEFLLPWDISLSIRGKR